MGLTKTILNSIIGTSLLFNFCASPKYSQVDPKIRKINKVVEQYSQILEGKDIGFTSEILYTVEIIRRGEMSSIVDVLSIKKGDTTTKYVDHWIKYSRIKNSQLPLELKDEDMELRIIDSEKTFLDGIEIFKNGKEIDYVPTKKELIEATKKYKDLALKLRPKTN